MTFNGFPPGKVNFTRVPSLFFRELLPAIDSLEELKVTLYALWQVTRLEGEVRYLELDDFTTDPEFMAGMGQSPEEQFTAVEEGLKRAALRGTLLQAEVPGTEGKQIYFFNSPKGRRTVDALRDGSWRPSDGDGPSAALSIERPNIFQLYEENIGPLTPLIADTLKDAEKQYPSRWIREALEIAVANNVRKWNYVEAILNSWQKEGRDERKDRRYSQKDRHSYLEDEFSEFIED